MSNSKLWLAILTLCTACGSSFEAGGSGGGGGSAANAGTPGSDGGSTSSAGSSSAGSPSAGASSAGAPSAGSGGVAAGGAPAGGAGGSSAGAGGRAGAGGSAGVDCTALKAEYAAALDKARVCDKGSTAQCDTGSTLPAIGCGCPVLVNAKSEATTTAKQKYQAFQDAKCPVGPICNIACLAYTSAMCSQQTMGSGNVFVCTGSQGVITN